MAMSCGLVCRTLLMNARRFVQFLSLSIGPSEVTIFSAEVLAAIDGPGNHCTKAAWYDALLPESLVNTSRDKATHSQRRRLWDVAFTPKGGTATSAGHGALKLTADQ